MWRKRTKPNVKDETKTRYYFRRSPTDPWRYTNGQFIGWAGPSGPLGFYQAGFALRKGDVLWLSENWLREDALKLLPTKPGDNHD